MLANGLGLGEVGDLEAPVFNLVQKLIESIDVQPSTKAPLLPIENQ